MWLDALCLRQNSTTNDQSKEGEWKLDVPTICNIYCAAVGIARYFNGLGLAFNTKGWGNPRHGLCRAWTLQEIRSENTIVQRRNIDVQRSNIAQDQCICEYHFEHSKVGAEVTTLRQALHPIMKLAAQ